MLRFSANLGLLWPELPLLQRVGAAARAGFRAIELHFPYEVAAVEMAATCRHHDVRLLGINTPPGNLAGGEFGLAALPGRERDFAASFDQAIRYCETTGARAIHCMTGIVTADEHDRARDVLLENLSKALTRVAAHDLTLLLEPLNPHDHPDYFYSTLDQAVGLITQLGSARVRLQFDVYHVARSEGDVLTKLERYCSLIGNVQIAGVPDRAEPDEGEIAYPAIFAALERLHYEGWVACEYRPRGSTDDGLSWMHGQLASWPTGPLARQRD